MKRIVCLFILVFAFLFFPTDTRAAANTFSVNYKVNYDVSESGTTTVTDNVTIKNLSDRYYVSHFTVKIGSVTISNVSANNSNGSIPVRSQIQDNKTVITLTFPNQISGLGKVQSFTISYKSEDFARRFGKVWEVNLPRVYPTSELNRYDLTLKVPIDFGEPSLVYPKADNQTVDNGKIIFSFSKNTILNKGVSISFGDYQFVSFRAHYHLKSSSLLPKLQSIVIPSDSSTQQVFINWISPLPENVTLDRDGNYLAWYRLKHKEELNIKLLGEAKISANNPFYTQSKLSPADLKTELKSDLFWETGDSEITDELKNILKDQPHKTRSQRARLAYNFVVSYLKYNYKKWELNSNERLGAVTALNHPNDSLDQEYADLFITLARALGVPARRVVGISLATNDKLRPTTTKDSQIHYWDEYLDDQDHWVMVDPTWEATTGGINYFDRLDLEHIILFVQGESSISPLIDGNFDLSIPSKLSFPDSISPKLEIDSPQAVWKGIPGSLKVTVINQGGYSFSPGFVTLSSNVPSFFGEKNVFVPQIPPFGNFSFIVNLNPGIEINKSNAQVEVSFLGSSVTKEIQIKSLVPWNFGKPYILPFILGIVFIIFYLLVLNIHIYIKRSKAASSS